MAPQSKIKAVFFDFMGTCVDWHSSAVQAMPSAVPQNEASQIAIDWHQQYFYENSQLSTKGLPPEDIDITLARALSVVLDRNPEQKAHFDDAAKRNMVEKWHSQAAWPDVQQAIRSLREDLGLDVLVHGNGTPRMQMDLCRSSGLNFSMLFSSLLLGFYKPDPKSYKRGLELVQLGPDEVVMVAAHAYDLRGAQKCGLRTAYIHRWSDDTDEDMEKVKTEFDVFLENMEELPATIKKMNEVA
ncbi:related to hydrolase (HAD superfamily) [Phialocephala subalpina]|uniref:Related to hydrolase (HAD superfamily) n=1 Tax=Phialocephala subalpina TaxID=576137 RepID=A0A1L7XRM9_9HELO|nr:related to hydrolase (HAD superfamily) [Phialocephala subalpina]